MSKQGRQKRLDPARLRGKKKARKSVVAKTYKMELEYSENEGYPSSKATE